MKGCREWNPRQNLLLPPSLLDWLPKDHAVYFLLDVVEEMDLSAIEDVLQAKDHRGTRPHPPRMMVGLLLYGYCAGVFSSSSNERRTRTSGFACCAAEHIPTTARSARSASASRRSSAISSFRC